MSYRGLGFIYTNKCTANCSICCFNCSPKCNYKLSKEKVVEIIGEAIKNDIRYIGFTGGEPFLYLNEIEQIIKEFGEKCYFTITTNGFWANERKKQMKFY